jgi:HlyD family secretion protein
MSSENSKFELDRRTHNYHNESIPMGKKIIITLLALVVLGGGVYASLRWSQRDLVVVQTTAVAREDLTAVVTASGEIKPKTYINLGANATGPITELLVKEGDRVRKNQVVARIENTQASADVAAQKAAIASAEADSAAAEAGMKAQDDSIATQVATLERYKSELDRAKVSLDRYEEMWKEKIAAKQDYDQKKSDYDSAAASVRENEARLSQQKSQRAQTLAQLTSAQRRVAQAVANQQRLDNVLARYDVLAPLDGVVTNLPVRVGETVVPGVQNSAASTIMTIADMSLITAEVDVDETDIVNVHLRQEASVSIEAMPNQTFMGHVIEIGNSAILRSTGEAASQSATSTQEAKDFKVTVALDNPPEQVRPGLSATAKITTATRHEVVAIPIQALTVRTKGDLEEQDSKTQTSDSTKPLDPVQEKERREEVQGVFVVNGDKAEFHKVETGIAGATDIEVLSGIEAGEQIVTGSYKAIRSMRNGVRVKVDNRTETVTDSKS